MIRVTINNRQRRLRFKQPWLRAIVRRVLEGEGIAEARISLVLLDDAAIHRVNKRFLNHDEPTDVITFPWSAPGGKPLEGELLISTETAARTARSLNRAAQDEAALYVIHGLLHLCGYDDILATERQRMRRRERHYLKKLRINVSAVDA
jgi:probable rRNA maturation factor